MIKHIWTVLCKESRIEAETNNISLIDAYESLQFKLNIDDKSYDPAKPITGPFNFEIVSLFYRDKKGTHEEFSLLLTILDPKGVKINETPAKSEFKAEHNRVRNRIKFENIMLTTSGTYIFQLYLEKEGNSKKEQLAAIPLDMQISVNGKER
jgi:hypothetical protein